MILDFEVDFKAPIILMRSLPAASRFLVDMEKGQMKFMFNNEEETFYIYNSMKPSGEH